MSAPRTAAGVPVSTKLLCAVYAAIAVAALIATWSQNVAYLHDPANFVPAFSQDSKVTPASRSLTVDILLFFLAAAIFMVLEARKHGIKFVWAYIAGGFLIAISVTFPLFLIARERRLAKTDPTRRITAIDAILLAVFAVALVGVTIWVGVL